VGIENAYLYEELSGERSSLQQKVDVRTLELREALSRLKESDAVKDRFLSSVSHEMKTPLTSIISYTELLLSFTNETAETREEFLKIIKEEAEKLHQMTARVLYFPELESKRESASYSESQLDEVVIEAAKKLKGRIRAMDQKLSIRIRKPIFKVKGEEKRLFTVFYNLIENASKFSPRGTVVQVEAETVRSKQRSTAGEPDNNGMPLPHIRVLIRDQGEGVSREDQERIFDRFEQGGDLLTSKPNGIGMGLPIARKIIQDHGGRIQICNAPGQGSEFIVLLAASDQT